MGLLRSTAMATVVIALSTRAEAGPSAEDVLDLNTRLALELVRLTRPH